MSERVFGVLLLLLSAAGLVIGWDLRAPVSYEPVGPRAFPLLVFVLIGACALALVFSRRAPTRWAPPAVLGRVGGLFVVVLLYALLFDKLGFIVSTTLMCLPLARLFGASWKQALAAGACMGVALFILFDRVLDVALPAGQWLKPMLG
ncbi:MAG: tripartite tricarboxylate transporter TctB family protein [Rhodocyclaceae bacterium]|nr:tripartite tricarboxylate transporter TctB family protein [Rhodocyclaceae bacterium]